MKKIKLKLQGENTFEEYLRIMNENIDEKKLAINSFENLNDINYYTISYKEECEEEILSYLSFYLINKALNLEFNSSEVYEDNKEYVKSTILGTIHFSTMIMIELKRFFDFNETLNENVFLKFNMIGFNQEVKEINKYAINKNKRIDAENMLIEECKKNNIDIDDLSELKIEYINSEINLITKSGGFINKNNIYDKLKIKIDIDEEDGWGFDIYFCTMVCIFFKTKTLYIKREFIELYEDLKENFLSNGVSVTIILGE